MRSVLDLRTHVARSVVLAVAIGGVAASGCSEHPGKARTPQQWHDEVAQEIDARKGALAFCMKASNSPNSRTVVTVYLEGRPDRLALHSGKFFFTTFQDADADSIALWDGAKLSPPGKDETHDLEVDECVRGVLADLPMPAGDSHIGIGKWRIVLDPKAPPSSG